MEGLFKAHFDMASTKQLLTQAGALIIKTNLTIAATLLVSAAILTLSGDYQLVDNNSDLYGPLAQNLRLMLLYLAVGEINILLYCWFRNKQPALIWLGLFYLSLIGGLEFYSNVNQIPVDPSYDAFFFYQGLSHILFGMIYLKNRLFNGHKTEC